MCTYFLQLNIVTFKQLKLIYIYITGLCVCVCVCVVFNKQNVIHYIKCMLPVTQRQYSILFKHKMYILYYLQRHNTLLVSNLYFK